MPSHSHKEKVPPATRKRIQFLSTEVVGDVGQAELLHRPAAVLCIKVKRLKWIPLIFVVEACTGNHLCDNGDSDSIKMVLDGDSDDELIC